MNKKLRIILITTVSLILIFFISLYMVVINSEPYSFAKKYVSNNDIVKEKLGNLTNISLAYFGYNVSYTGPNGVAKFKIKVTSKKGKGTVYISLDKESGKWNVKHAKLVSNESEIDINPNI